jgi:FlaA1/EpsC-like NDP-sugar epimerase
MGRKSTAFIFLVLDVIFLNCAYLSGLFFRFENSIPPEYLYAWRVLAPGATLLTIFTYYFFGLYRRLWRYASIGELYAVLEGVTVGSLFVVALSYIFIYPNVSIPSIPRSVFFVAWLMNLVFTGGSRFYLRSASHFRDASDYAKRKRNIKKNGEVHKRALIVGAGDAGAIVVREFRNHPALGVEPVGFIDDDIRKKGLYLLDVPVLGTREDIPSIVDDALVDEIIIAMPSAPGSVIRDIVEICKNTSAKLKTLPGVYELIDGRVTVTQIRDVQVEDLLGREPVQVDLDEIAEYVAGKAILVTGAGGSIGSELCRQLISFRPSMLILLDKDENNLFEIEQELRERRTDPTVRAELVDVRNKRLLEEIFDKNRPQVIFHAAAYKHVPMMEHFPQHAVSNNILGTYNVAALAKAYGAEIFIFVSTDKAVHPSSVMGATKRAAELVIQDLNEKCLQEGIKTRFAAVRFGNVLGSRGSVIPTFKRQIIKGGPVTVTHPDMIRYFMTIPEAVQLIIQAGALTRGGEIFALDMGKPVKIIDLARDLIRLSGLVPDEDIKIDFIGIRPGEKLSEELFTTEEEKVATKNSRIFISRNGEVNFQEVADLLRELDGSSVDLQPLEAINFLKKLFPAWHYEHGDFSKDSYKTAIV